MKLSHKIPVPRLVAACLIAGLTAFSTGAKADGDRGSAGTETTNWELDDYLAYAFQNSPDLKSSFHLWQAESDRADQSDNLPDPTLVYTHYIENVETRVGPQNWALSLQQPIPWPGKLKSRHRIARSASEAAHSQYEASRLQLQYRVRAAYYDYYLLAREIEITGKQIDLLRFWESVVRVRYTTALAEHPDLIESQIELATLEDRLRSLNSRIRPSAVRLRTVTGLPDSTVLPLPDGIPRTTPDLVASVLIDAAVGNSPDLGAIEALIKKEESSLSLARQSYFPDLRIGVSYISTGTALNPATPESGKDPWTFSVGITLPIWFGGNGSEKSEALSRLRSQEYRRDETVNRLKDRIETASWEYNDAVRRSRFIAEDLLSRTEQSLNVTFASYQAGEADFLQLLETERKFFEFELRVEQQKVRGLMKLAELEMLTGYDLSKIEPSGIQNPNQ